MKKDITRTKFGNVELLPGLTNGGYPFCNSLYIEAGGGVLIDPSCGKPILKELKENHGGVKHIILTHFHEDHLLFASHFENAVIHIHPADAPAMVDFEKYLEFAGVLGKPFEKEMRALFSGDIKFPENSVVPDLVDGEILDFDGAKVEILHTPGHTPGHVCLRVVDDEVIYLGDVDLTRFGPWYGDRYSDVNAFRASMERLKNEPAKVFIPSHGRRCYTDDISEELVRYAAILEEREQKLLDFIQEPRTQDEISKARMVFGQVKSPSTWMVSGEWATMEKHLTALMGEGRVTTDGERWWRADHRG